MSAVLHCDYEAMVLSDHSPLGLQILFETKYDTIKWMFDNSLLTDKVFVEQTKAQIGLYLETNYTTDVSKSTVWEAFKAYMRGQIFSHSISIKKRRKEQKKEINGQNTRNRL